MKIYALATLSTGLEVVDYVHSRISLSGIIGLSKREPSDTISGYQYLAPYCEKRGVPFIEVKTYGLTAPDDRLALDKLEIDVLLVMGWQRLIPDWLIQQCRVAAIGGHGSAVGITGGRGRSPQNWALIMGKTQFHLSIFRITTDIDAGDIIDSRTYSLNEQDDIQSSYYKAAWNTSQMIVDFLKSDLKQPQILQKQDSESARYLPQRLPEDGAIDWTRGTKQIYDFIRALTHPYPGAFSDFYGGRLMIWRARPFENSKEWHSRPGEIVTRFESGALLIRTGDGLLLIDEYAIEPEGGLEHLHEGTCLVSADFSEQMETIIKRHQQRYPHLPLASDVLNLSKS